MLVRNAYTGALHEVPDQQLYEVGEPVFDGFGNPVGGIFDDIMGAVKNVVSAPIQAATSMLNPMNALNPIGAVGNILGNIIPGMGPGQSAAAPVPPPQMAMMGGAAPWQQAAMMNRFHPPFPAGWQHSPLPYTGLGPKRLYMRCAVWPGPAGLVPSYAATMTPQQQQAMMPQGAGGGYGGRHRGHGHRRRR